MSQSYLIVRTTGIGRNAPSGRDYGVLAKGKARAVTEAEAVIVV